MRISSYNPNVSDEERKIPFYAVTVGENESQEPVHRPMGVADYQLLYTVSGRGSVRINGKESSVSSGSVFILPPFTPHEYKSEYGEWRTLWITYNGKGAAEHFPFKSEIRRFDGFEAFYKRIIKQKNKNDWRFRTSFVLYGLLLELEMCESLVESEMVGDFVDISAAVQYISSHYAETVELSTLATLVGVSEGHFCRMFKKYTHMRPIEYITHLKIERAKAYLVEDPNMSITDIAEAVGYSSSSYFSKVFRERVGVSAEKYRGNILDIGM